MIFHYFRSIGSSSEYSNHIMVVKISFRCQNGYFCWDGNTCTSTKRRQNVGIACTFSIPRVKKWIIEHSLPRSMPEFLSYNSAFISLYWPIERLKFNCAYRSQYSELQFWSNGAIIGELKDVKFRSVSWSIRSSVQSPQQSTFHPKLLTDMQVPVISHHIDHLLR